MSRTRRTALGVLLSALAVGAVAAPASAASTATPAAMRTALAHSASGYLTSADRAALKTDPAVARSVVDPAKSTTSVVAGTAHKATAAEVAAAPGVTAGFWCRSVTATRIARSTLGFTLYRFNNYVDWCWQDGGIIHEVPARYWYISSVDPTAVWQSLLGDVSYGLGTTRFVSQYQGHFQHCVIKYGCYGDTYPYVNLQVYNTGNYTYQTG